MSDIQLLTIIITLAAIFGAMYGNRKSVEDMRDVLRAEAGHQGAELKAILLRIENKVDHMAETQADHRERLARLEGGLKK